MSTFVARIGPSDHARRMSLAEIEPVEVQEGRLYELGRGVIVASEVPNQKHFAQIFAAQRQFFRYDAEHKGGIYSIGTGSE